MRENIGLAAGVPENKMWMLGVIEIYLIVLGIKDYLDRQIPVRWLAAGAILTVTVGVFRLSRGEMQGWEMVAGALPGMLLLLLARLSRKAGYADGIVLTELGMGMGLRTSIPVFCFSILLTALISMALLMLRRVRRDTKMPYLTAVAIVSLALYLAGGDVWR